MRRNLKRRYCSLLAGHQKHNYFGVTNRELLGLKASVDHLTPCMFHFNGNYEV